MFPTVYIARIREVQVQKWIIGIFSFLALITGVFAYQSQQFDFATLEGDRYRWDSMRGDWIVVNYFAEWCAPCLKEVPELNAFYKLAQSRGNVSLFAVSYDPLSHSDLSDIKDKYKMQFPVLDPENTKFMPIAKPQYLPATFIISPDGKVSKPLLGEQTVKSLELSLTQLQQSF
jgi:peroxiredoxin